MSIEEQNQTAEAAAPEVTFEQLRSMALEVADRNRELTGLITAILLSAGPRVELLRELEPEIDKHGFTVSWLEDGEGVVVEVVKLEDFAAEGKDEAPEPEQAPAPAEEVNEPA